MPLSSSHGRLSGSGDTLWVKDRIASLRNEVMQENQCVISMFHWVDGVRVVGGSFVARIARVSSANLRSTNETNEASMSVIILGRRELQMETNDEFTSSAYPALLFRVTKEVIDYNAGDMRRYEAMSIR